MTTHDPVYYAGRALEEDDAARRAACAEAKICHEKLAEAYSQRRMETLLAGKKGHMGVKAKADHLKRRQPIVSSNMPVLTPSPIMAASPLRRA
jgi:hypothetical protein